MQHIDWKDFGRDRKGTIAILFGVSAMVLFAVIGVSVDTARVYSLNDKVRSALDAAALAGAKLLDDPNATEGEVEDRARAYFETHAQKFKDGGASVNSFSVKTDRETGTVVASAVVDYKTTFGSLVSMSDISFKPQATVSYKTRKVELSLVLDVTGSMGDNGKLSAMKTAARELVEFLAANNPTNGVVRVAIAPYAAAVNVGAEYFTAATQLPVGADTCVIGRNSMPGAIVDEAPKPGRYFNIGPNGNDRYDCPTAKVLPLQDVSIETQRDALISRIDSLSANGYTAGHLGLGWGWFMVSPEWTSVWPAPSAPKPASGDVVKAVLLMTDGEFNTSYFKPNGNANGSDPEIQHGSVDLALGMCENMRDAGIVIYTVAFNAPPQAAATLSACADNPTNSFSAENASELKARFQLVADRLTRLRLSK